MKVTSNTLLLLNLLGNLVLGHLIFFALPCLPEFLFLRIRSSLPSGVLLLLQVAFHSGSARVFVESRRHSSHQTLAALAVLVVAELLEIFLLQICPPRVVLIPQWDLRFGYCVWEVHSDLDPDRDVTSRYVGVWSCRCALHLLEGTAGPSLLLNLPANRPCTHYTF